MTEYVFVLLCFTDSHIKNTPAFISIDSIYKTKDTAREKMKCAIEYDRKNKIEDTEYAIMKESKKNVQYSQNW